VVRAGEPRDFALFQLGVIESFISGTLIKHNGRFYIPTRCVRAKADLGFQKAQRDTKMPSDPELLCSQ